MESKISTVKFGGKFYEKKVAGFAKFIKFDKAGRNHKNIKKLSLNESHNLRTDRRAVQTRAAP